MEKIHFISTGGTIDSYYDGIKDTVVPNTESIIPSFIKRIKMPAEPMFTTICMKDSRSIIDDDRAQILKTIEESPAEHFIITHGTYTMPITARYLEQNLRKNSTVILTGSFIPLPDVVKSDGAFNLGYAVAQLQHLAKGTYICMNAQVLKPAEAEKLVEEGRFISTLAIS